MEIKGMRIRHYVFAIILVVITVAYLFMNIAYVKGFDGGVKGITAIFGGREILEDVLTLEFEPSYSGIIMLLLLGISVFLLIRSAGEKSNSLMGVCGGLLICCSLLNYGLFSNLEVEGTQLIELGINPVAYIYSLLCFGEGLLCFVYYRPAIKNK